MMSAKKINDNTVSYILNNWDSNLTKFVLDEINKCTYFRTTIISKSYINKILKIKNNRIKESLFRSTSNRTGRIVAELNRLGIITKYSNTTRGVWRNLHKGNLRTDLDEKMEQTYHIIKIKK